MRYCLSFVCIYSYTNTSIIKGWAALPWHSSSPIHCTTSASSHITPSMCSVGLTARVRFVALLSHISCLMNSQKSMLCTCTGKGCVFTYDAVGSYERTGYSAQGTGSTLMMPVLDNQLKSPSPLLLPARVSPAHLYLLCVCSVQWALIWSNTYVFNPSKNIFNVRRMLSHHCQSQRPSI